MKILFKLASLLGIHKKQKMNLFEQRNYLEKKYNLRTLVRHHKIVGGCYFEIWHFDRILPNGKPNHIGKWDRIYVDYKSQDTFDMALKKAIKECNKIKKNYKINLLYK